MTRTMVTGTSRRRVLRLLGGGLAAALLGVLGRGDQAAAEVVFNQCIDYGEAGGPAVITGEPGDLLLIGKLCPTCAHIEGAVCAAVINPGNKFLCRCYVTDDDPGPL